MIVVFKSWSWCAWSTRGIDLCDDWSEADGPLVLGHEGAGVVEGGGRGVQGVEAGDHVVLSCQSCGRCPPCRGGRPAHCGRFMEANFGFARIAEITGGGLDYVVETTGRPQLHRLAVELLNPGGRVALMTGEEGRDYLDGRRTGASGDRLLFNLFISG